MTDPIETEARELLAFWSDDFDMDLLKIIPVVKAMLGELAVVPMWTHGGETHGRLNHPSCWNFDGGVIAFFGSDPTRQVKSEGFYTSSPIIECTALEMFRDTWAHGCVVMLDGYVVWDSQKVWPHFETIMWFIREWGRSQSAHDAAVLAATKLLRNGVDSFRRIVAATPKEMTDA